MDVSMEIVGRSRGLDDLPAMKQRRVQTQRTKGKTEATAKTGKNKKPYDLEGTEADPRHTDPKW